MQEQSVVRRGTFHEQRDRSVLQSESSRSAVKLDTFIEQRYRIQQQKRFRLITTTTFNPDDTLVLFWHLIVLLCILVYFLELPVAVTFSNSYRNRDTTGYLFEIINVPCLMIFIINILVRFRTGYYQHGVLITATKKIFWHNLKFLVLDIIAIGSIGSSEIEEITVDEQTTRYIQPICLLFFLKAFDLYKIEQSINRALQLHRRLKAIFNLTMLIFFILFLCNTYACIFYSISYNYKQAANADTKDGLCWIDFVQAEGLYISEQDWIVQYIYSLYWASTTMLTVGYGDVVPRNRYQVMFDIVAEFTSCLVFAYSVNKIWEIKIELNDKKEKYQRKSNIINRFMRDKNVKSQIRGKVNAYLAHFYTQQKFRERGEEEEVIEELAPGLRQELYMDCYGFIFREFAVFRPFSEQFFDELVDQIEEVRYSEQEVIFYPGDEQNDFSLAYLFKGRVQSYIQLQRCQYIISEIPAGDLYGHYQFFSCLTASTALRACCYCLVYSLSISQWKTTMSNFLDDMEKYCEMRDSAQFLSNLQPLRIKCWLCGSNRHIAEDCARSTLDQCKILQIKNYKKSEQLQQRVFLHRRKFRLVEILNRGYIQEVNAMREFIVNRTIAEEGRDSHISELVGGNFPENSDLDRLSERFDTVYDEEEPLMERAPRKRPVRPLLRRANSQSPAHKFRKPSVSVLPSQHAAEQSQLVIEAVQPAPSQLMVEAEPQKVEIDKKHKFEYYFRHRNIEQIIAEQNKRIPLGRRQSKRYSIAMGKEVQTNLW